MDPIIGGALISGVGSVLGGLFGSNQAAKQAKMQKEFAQNGIRWRVADAKAAGIHPLYALGAQVTPYSPVSVGDGGFPALGQDLSRAYMATRTEKEKVDTFTVTSQQLQLQRLGLENQLLEAQIRKANEPSNPAPFPGSSYLLPGQTQSGLVRDVPQERVNAINNGTAEPGPVADVSFLKTQSGYIPSPSTDAKQRIEDNVFHEFQHWMRNNIVPQFSRGAFNPPYPAPKGAEWAYDLYNGYYLKAVDRYRREKAAVRAIAPAMFWLR